MTDVVIGIDIGGTITKIGLIEKNGNCISKASFRTKETKKQLRVFTIDKSITTIEENFNILDI